VFVASSSSYLTLMEECAMAPDISTTSIMTARHHLLNQPSDLAGHLAKHGPLPIPAASDPGWRESFGKCLASSGLVGRGGAAFPSSIKLASAQTAGRNGVIVVNGMEGEPASDKDKVLLSSVPHLVLDGAQLLAAATGAAQIIVAIPIGRDAIATAVQHAIKERRVRGHGRIQETVVRPPNRFVAGEESALAHWVASGRSLPIFRADKSVALRIGKRTALIHNTETLAHMALIARRGSAEFLSRGIPEEPGSTLVTISGAVMHPGVVEIDRGTPVDQIVALAQPIGSAAALLVGGYGGSWVGHEHFAVAYSSSALRAIGTSAGVGVIVVLGAPACGVAETARIARYMAQQGSGQCGPCVHGLPAIAEDLACLANGQPDPALMPRLLRRLDEVQGRGACRHPDGLVSLVRSALNVFALDVTAHERGEPCAFSTLPTQLRFSQSGKL
jgi:NADH:ubiquinone oxidoreductase subunit F (NADH-binding)